MNFFRGKIVSFSGIDGAGKSTQIALLTDLLANKKYKTYYLWSRGGYTYFFCKLKYISRKLLGRNTMPMGNEKQRDILINKPIVKIVWLLMAITDLIFLYGIYLRFKKLMGYYILADRYLIDTWIDFKINFREIEFDQWFLWKLLEKITPLPECSFMLLVSAKISVARSKKKKEPFPDSLTVLQQRLKYYYGYSIKNLIHVIHCEQPITKVANEIKKYCTYKNVIEGCQ